MLQLKLLETEHGSPSLSIHPEVSQVCHRRVFIDGFEDKTEVIIASTSRNRS